MADGKIQVKTLEVEASWSGFIFQSENWVPVNFDIPFLTDNVVVIAVVQTKNEELGAVRIRIQSLNRNGFMCWLEEGEADDAVHDYESVCNIVFTGNKNQL